MAIRTLDDPDRNWKIQVALIAAATGIAATGAGFLIVHKLRTPAPDDSPVAVASGSANPDGGPTYSAPLPVVPDDDIWNYTAGGLNLSGLRAGRSRSTACATCGQAAVAPAAPEKAPAAAPAPVEEPAPPPEEAAQPPLAVSPTEPAATPTDAVEQVTDAVTSAVAPDEDDAEGGDATEGGLLSDLPIPDPQPTVAIPAVPLPEPIEDALPVPDPEPIPPPVDPSIVPDLPEATLPESVEEVVSGL